MAQILNISAKFSNFTKSELYFKEIINSVTNERTNQPTNSRDHYIPLDAGNDNRALILFIQTLALWRLLTYLLTVRKMVRNIDASLLLLLLL